MLDQWIEAIERTGASMCEIAQYKGDRQRNPRDWVLRRGGDRRSKSKRAAKTDGINEDVDAFAAVFAAATGNKAKFQRSSPSPKRRKRAQRKGGASVPDREPPANELGHLVPPRFTVTTIHVMSADMRECLDSFHDNMPRPQW